MTIEESKNSVNQSLLSTLAKVTTKNTTTEDSFASILASQLNGSSSSSDESTASTAATESNAAVEAFKEALTSKGALQFYQEYNQEKIEQLMEEKKAELEDKLGLSADSVPPLSGEDRENTLSMLDMMLDAYRKQLQEKMQAEDELEQETTMLNTFLQDLA
ncbi:MULTISPECIES: hypothetical protein [unclassified Sulfurospirillum]|uniref:hypothetical protein n=1 Tax=unclassified Sulfurospirillum TaxID=2618290 RepID=UPI0005077986|nr:MULTISPECIES: hypothetical protein [unclassified Sulfurospirillum]KFL33313.1 hypothetical protein JU57_11745 [Sulfurospirillum sp. SCADC]